MIVHNEKVSDIGFKGMEVEKMKMEVYLDNAATTRCYKAVGELVLQMMCEDYGNPSSLHLKGVEAERYVKNAREDIAKLLKVDGKELIFTSGGTESDNLAIIGGVRANHRRGNHIITTEIEHSGVLNTMKYLEEEGFEVSYLPVDEQGVIDLKVLESSLRPETILVSIMHVNNEVGSIQALEEIGKIVKGYDASILFHSDGVQGFGKCVIYPKKIGLDMYSVSAHKIHGPKGVGFLYKDERAKILPISYGGGQQRGLRSGTDNVPGIVGLSLAAKMIYENIEEKQKYLFELKTYFIEKIRKIEDVYVVGSTSDDVVARNVDIVSASGGIDANGIACPIKKGMEKQIPHIINVSFKGVSSEVLLHALEEKGVYVSSGSACSTHGKKKSDVLQRLNVPKKYQEGSIRISMSEFTTKEEIDYTLEILYNCIPMLRRFKRK